MKMPNIESQRDSVPKPRVARHELPWVIRSNPSQPQRGCVWPRAPIRRNPVEVDDAFDSRSQGSASLNPGLWVAAPLGQSERTSDENARLTRALNDAEAELNDRVYRLFELSADEIKLLQKEVEH